MNRASLALGLLLGTVAVALVAAGVVRDLERVESRSVAPIVAETIRTPQSVKAPQVAIAPKVVVVLDEHQYRPLPADPVALLPLTSHTIQVDVTSWMKQIVAIPKFEARKSDPPLPRVILDRRELVQILAAVMTVDISTVDRLIRENDGIDDVREARSVPFGHVIVGGRVVVLKHRGVADESHLAWTGGLHYGQNVRETLQHRDPTSALIATKSERLPGEKMRLWSNDRQEAVDAITKAVRNAGRGTVALAEQVRAVVTIGQWANSQFAAGLDRVAVHVKRDAWLATIPHPATQAPVQSAQRPNGGKG